MNMYRCTVLKMNFRISIILQCLALLQGVIAKEFSLVVAVGNKEGTIKSPHYPDSYNNDDNCTWILMAPENHRIELTFQQPFSIESPCCDWVRIYEGSSISETQLIGNFNGSTLPPKQFSVGNTMTVNFRSDDSHVDTGFSASYRKVRPKFYFVSKPRTVEIAGGNGESVNMTCRVNDYRALQVYWTRDGVTVLNGDRFTIQPSGDLEIIDVEYDDRGTYVCHAGNGFDVIEVAASLTVRNRTFIKRDYPLSSVHNVTADASPVHIKCRVSEHDKMLNVSVEWKRDNELINSSSDGRITIVDTVEAHRMISSKLTIENVTVADTGRYVCVAKTRIDEHSDYVQLDVRMSSPNSPNVTAVQCYANEAKVGWQSTPDADSYVVQYNTSFAPDVWQTAVDNISANEKNYTVRVPLTSYGQNYTFRVLARNEAGFSDPSAHFPLVCSPEEEVPKKNPDNVIVQRREPTRLVVSWTPLSPSDHGGSQFYYEVWWKPNTPYATWQSVKLVGWKEAGQFTINVELTPQEYVIFVLAGNVKGVAMQPVQKVYAYAGQASLKDTLSL